MLLEFAESGCPIFRATSPLSRCKLKSKGHGKLSIHYAADQETIETIFRIIVSANQLSLYGAVAEMCKFCMDAGFLSIVENGKYFMTKDTAEFSQFTSAVACREYTLPRDEGASEPKGWIRGNTKIGPELEIATCCLHGKYGVEIRIMSVNRDNSHSWVRISHGSNKFVMNLNNNEQEKKEVQHEDYALKIGFERICMSIEGKSKTTKKRTCWLFTENRSQ